MDGEDTHILRKWISVGDIIVLATALIAVGINNGQTKAELRALTNQVSDLRAIQTGPTPGAAQALAAIQEKDRAQDQAILELRIEVRDSRREILEAVKDVKASLDKHMDKAR